MPIISRGKKKTNQVGQNEKMYPCLAIDIPMDFHGVETCLFTMANMSQHHGHGVRDLRRLQKSSHTYQMVQFFFVDLIFEDCLKHADRDHEGLTEKIHVFYADSRKIEKRKNHIFRGPLQNTCGA